MLPPNASRIKHRLIFASLSLMLLVAAGPARAGGGPLGIDHEWAYDNSGIWARSKQVALEYGLAAALVGGAIYEGGESRFGRTLWESVDSTAGSAVVALVMKRAFSRVRPIDANNPDLWFKGGSNESFPSGEVTEVSAIVTPLILEYGDERPGIYALELLPLYDGVARLKVQAHWQSDVIAGFALGTAAGWFAHRNKSSPFILRIMPNSIYVGMRTH
jgi:hypothetical protein